MTSSAPDSPSPKDFRVALEHATAQLQGGPVLEAIKAHQEVLRLAPRHADSWYNLAWLQQRARQFEDALASYERALDCGIAQPEEVHLNRAVLLAEHLYRMDEAEQALGTALALNPRYVPALVNLGNLHEQRGDRELALAAYERALALDPHQSLALSRLPDLRPLVVADDPLITRLQQAVKRPGIPAEERADLGFGLGKALDRAGAYDAAFAAYVAANGASRECAESRHVYYDRLQHERVVDHLIGSFCDPAPKTGSRGPSPSIFICGMFRSGSTLVEQILASHPEVTAGGEIDLLPMLVQENLNALREPFTLPAPDLIERMRTRYLEGITGLFPNAQLVTDKRPDNFLHIGLIKQMFPHAKIVHTVRNPLDNCLAVFFLHLSHSMPYALDLLDIAHWYRQYQRLMAHWKSLYGDDIHDVSYDGLVADPVAAIKALLDHCALPWDARCLAFHETKSVVKTPSAWQVRQPLYKRSSGRWRHYAQHLKGLRVALGVDAD